MQAIEKKIVAEILSAVEIISANGRLHQEKNFGIRAQAIDDLEFKIIDRIDALMEDRVKLDKMSDLKEFALKTKRELETVDLKMFQQLRIKISRGEYHGAGFLKLLDEYFDNNLKSIFHQDRIGYDELDIFLNGLLTYQKIPTELKVREPGMVYYQKTPARIILELIKRAEFNPRDVFIDLGAGLGQVVMLVNLITAVRSIGVEFEPAFCAYARARAEELNLKDVEFICGDARFADFSGGTVFFMYTPFEGKILQETLQNLIGEAEKNKIRIFTYGPCTPIIAQQNWLERVNEMHMEPDGLGEFKSL
jgi:Histone methylation protein DOT1